MSDDWDPFAADEPAPAPKPAAAAATTVTASGGIASLEKEDIDEISDEIIKRMKAQKPWDAPLNPAPDTTWHEQVCTLDDWRHVDVQMKVGRGIAMVVYNRPEQNNSLQDTMGFGTNDALYALHARPDVRVAVFTGEGRMYCAGGDPKSWQANAARLRGEVIVGDGTVANRVVEARPFGEEVGKSVMGLMDRAYKAGASKRGQVSLGQLCTAKQWHTWYTLPQFTICLVNGSAMGGGVGCVCCCDYVIAVKRAFFVLSEVKIGVIPATISPYVIAKIGASNAKRFFCAAENLSALKAKDYGIVDEVVENMKEGHERIQEIVKLISQCGPRAVAGYKEIVLGTSGVPFGKALTHYTCRKQSAAADGPELKAGMAAEKAGAKPAWEAEDISFPQGWPMVGVVEPKK